MKDKDRAKEKQRDKDKEKEKEKPKEKDVGMRQNAAVLNRKLPQLQMVSRWPAANLP